MTNLEAYAEREMRRAGLYDKDSDYDGMIPEAVMAMIRAHGEQGHSGGSHYVTMQIFDKVVRYQPLTPIDSTPEDWMEVGEHQLPSGTLKMWQSVRQSNLFSTDGGKTWYCIDDPKRKNWPNRTWFQRYVTDPLGL